MKRAAAIATVAVLLLASACAVTTDDPEGDVEGTAGAPASELDYIDLTGANASSSDDGMELRLTVTEAIPETSGVDEELMYSFAVDVDRDGSGEYFVWAISSRGDPFFFEVHNSARIESSPTVGRIDGSTVVFEVPWSAVGGAQVLDVRAAAHWETFFGSEGRDIDQRAGDGSEPLTVGEGD